jgi:hypothetical protein
VRAALVGGHVAVVTRCKAGDVWSVAKDGQPHFDPRRRLKLMRTSGVKKVGSSSVLVNAR